LPLAHKLLFGKNGAGYIICFPRHYGEGVEAFVSRW